MALTKMNILCMVGFVVLVFLNRADGLTCASCSSVLNPTTCGENPTVTLNDASLISSNCTTCMKTTTEINLIITKSYVFTRSCVSSAQTAGCTSSGGTTTCYCTDADLCNGANTIRVTTFALLGSILVALSLMRS